MTDDTNIANRWTKRHRNILFKQYEDKDLVRAAQVIWTNSPTESKEKSWENVTELKTPENYQVSQASWFQDPEEWKDPER